MNDLLSSDVSCIEAEGGLTHLFYIRVVLKPQLLQNRRHLFRDTIYDFLLLLYKDTIIIKIK